MPSTSYSAFASSSSTFSSRSTATASASARHLLLPPPDLPVVSIRTVLPRPSHLSQPFDLLHQNPERSSDDVIVVGGWESQSEEADVYVFSHDASWLVSV
ncbi:hypothetical protein RHGRI_038837 [Rhododendron griersonianum]|uniref:Uncharacterized protein n=1 Tax=Rhododendron griersonianum TaxID=479676 RepID=A0AAV6HL60_9ERIC|nr:hypothetical protein RHGRI_038837 [Rhododendron griersonianum]